MANPIDTLGKLEQIRRLCVDISDSEFQEAFDMLLETGDHRKASNVAVIGEAIKTIRIHVGENTVR